MTMANSERSEHFRACSRDMQVLESLLCFASSRLVAHLTTPQPYPSPCHSQQTRRAEQENTNRKDALMMMAIISHSSSQVKGKETPDPSGAHRMEGVGGSSGAESCSYLSGVSYNCFPDSDPMQCIHPAVPSPEINAASNSPAQQASPRP